MQEKIEKKKDKLKNSKSFNEIKKLDRNEKLEKPKKHLENDNKKGKSESKKI